MSSCLNPGALALALLFTFSATTAHSSEASSEHSADSTAPKLIASSQPGWPQFRGPRRDGVSDERNLLSSWPEGGPRQVWSSGNIGRGFSSPVISNGRLFITGDVGDELHLFALDLTGKIQWTATNGLAWKTPYPGARSTPTISETRVYHQNAHGRVAAFDVATGKEVWAVDLLKKFRGNNITWGLSENLLVDDKAVYAVAGGADALLVALDKRTGNLLWKSQALYDSEGDRALENASYVSPILVQFHDRRLLIGCSLKNLFCADADTGAIYWTRRMPTSYSVLAMMPVLVGDGIFMTAPHGRGGRLWKLLPPTPGNDRIDVEEVWTTRLDTCQGGVVVADGKIFGSFYPGRRGWAAVDANSGAVLYEESGFVKGAILYADDRLYALCEDGWMLLLEGADSEFKVHGKFRLAEASDRDAWAHPVVYDGRMYLRYHERLVCYDVRARAE